MHARVISETAAHQGCFLQRCPQPEKAILTDARNRLMGNGYAQDMGQIPDARNLHNGCTQPL